MPHNAQSHDATDAFLAGYLVLSPAWASWLGDVNELLTTVSLLIGIGFALIRLWFLLTRN
jgi:hypothetical protein